MDRAKRQPAADAKKELKELLKAAAGLDDLKAIVQAALDEVAPAH